MSFSKKRWSTSGILNKTTVGEKLDVFYAKKAKSFPSNLMIFRLYEVVV